jgi:hypothetical protein
MGYTDSSGHFTYTVMEQTSNIGSYTQIWSVGDVTAMPAISFMVGELGVGGTISTTDIGQTADGHLVGVSVVSITNGTVTTYSATELDDAASAYYSVGTVGTLSEEGTPIQSGTASGSRLADGQLLAAGTAWKDYTLQTDHYVVAYMPYGAYFVNPFYYQDGSCDGYSSDCTFGPGGGDYYVVAAAVSIYLGSTIADQTNVPQDGSIPFADDSFLEQPHPPPTGAIEKRDAWKKAISDAAKTLFLAESIYASQNTPHPLPYLLEVYDDCQTTTGLRERRRTYTIKDTNGNPWVNSNPLTVWENLIYIFGTGGMPEANNPANLPRVGGWSTSNGEIDPNGRMTDYYGQHFPQPEVDYWQQYWATGFNAPGLVAPSLPAYSNALGLAVPLMIKDYSSTSHQGVFATQGVELNSAYVGINGDGGPSKSCN